MISRRQFIAGSIALAASNTSRKLAAASETILVNDVHSQLNPTRVLGISQPGSLEDVQNLIRAARRDRKVISIAGGRHAMGGQQFGADTLLIDIRKMRRILTLDRKRGILEVEAGIEWPELIDGYLESQRDVGNCPEANRCRSIDDFRNNCGECTRSRPEDEALCQ